MQRSPIALYELQNAFCTPLKYSSSSQEDRFQKVLLIELIVFSSVVQKCNHMLMCLRVLFEHLIIAEISLTFFYSHFLVESRRILLVILMDYSG